MSKAERKAIKDKIKAAKKAERMFYAHVDMEGALRRDGFDLHTGQHTDPLAQFAIDELGAQVKSVSQIAPRQQPVTVVSSVEHVNLAPTAQAIPAPEPPQCLPKSAVSAPAGMVKIDPGISPLMFHQDLETAYRLWLIAHQLNRDLYRGRGWITVQSLQDALTGFGVTISNRHFKRAIAQGVTGGLWNQGGQRLHLTAFIRLWHDSSEILCQQNKREVVEASRPGNPVYIAPGGSLQDFKATLYTAWIDARNADGEGFTGSRFFLCQVWKCSENTLRAWEQGRVDHTANYVQYAGNDPRVIPAHATAYPDRNGVVRYTWRKPNTYTSAETIIEHRAKGQKSKARNARNHILRMYQLDAIPADLCAAETIGKLYFTDKVDAPGSAFKAVRQHLRKHQDYQRPHYARLGTKAGYKSVKPVVIWEVTTGTQQTGLDERDFAQERRKAFRDYFAFDAQYRRKYTC